MCVFGTHKTHLFGSMITVITIILIIYQLADDKSEFIGRIADKPQSVAASVNYDIGNSIEVQEPFLMEAWNGSLSSDLSFISSNCEYKLDISLWSNISTAKICTLPIGKDVHVTGAVRNGQTWERSNQIQMFTQLLPKYPNAAFIDIGAHMGLYSISAAKTGHRVFAFEPNKETWKYLQGSIEVNHLQSDVSLFQHALLDKRQPCAVFTTPDRANQGHTIVEGANDPIICEKDINAVKTALLDDLLPHFKAYKLKEAVIKIDVEAAEPLVFLGGRAFLRKIMIPYIMMEFHQMQLKYLSGNSEEKLSIDALVKELSSLGYYALPIGQWKQSGLELSSFTNWPLDVVWHLNRSKIVYR
ncbi:uncharacterized protein LOC142345306 isoform X2 [Convolutriloba macropyga]|uniref:uncharacterized protein LOC142345306 isoform X2 n=1 Tax=Convolutriloba macropyga TaxID=536237 RepID=UPI003F529058